MMAHVVMRAGEIREDWRQPPPEPYNGRAVSRARVTRTLTEVFEGSEDANKQQILDLVAGGGPYRTILDLGCYNGAFTRAIARAARAEEVHGVELLPEHAAAARERGVTVLEADASRPLPYDSGSFDLVHSNQMIEHLRETDGFLRECRRLVAPEGRVVISTNNFSSWHNVVALAMGWQPFPCHVSDEIHVGNPADPRRGMLHADAGQTHARIFTGRSLSELAAHHGLATVQLAVNGYYPFPPRLARRLAAIDPRHAAYLVAVFKPMS